MGTRFTLLVLANLICALGFAKPVFLEGPYQKQKRVLPMAHQHSVLTSSPAEISDLKRREYTCKRVDARELCQKLSTELVNLSPEVQARMWEMADSSITFERSASSYIKVNDSESVQEWQRDQVTKVDKLRFEKLTWRELHRSEGQVTKIILNSGRHSAKAEYLKLDDNTLGAVIKLRVTHQKGWSDYWAIIPFLRR
ncbi:MAG: hypothetical protein ACK5Y2_00150 [Bdellovibrionales bacterium]